MLQQADASWLFARQRLHNPTNPKFIYCDGDVGYFGSASLHLRSRSSRRFKSF
jgi:hypothetical protein